MKLQLTKAECKTLGLGDLKGCVHYILASLFLGLKESTCKTKKNVFISLQKLFSFSSLKSNFRMLDVQIS